MATEHKLSANGRKDEGKGASRRLRHAGMIPAIVYGGEDKPQNIQLEHEKTWVASQHEWFYASILTLDIDGKPQQVLLRDMQRHPFKQQIMHLDFQRVSANTAIRVNVPLHFVNQDKSPAGKSAEVVLTHELNEVEISCLPKDLPEFIEVDLAEMKLGDTVHLSDVKLPKGVELAHKIDDEHNPAVAVARHARAEAEAEGEAPAAESAEVPAAKQDEDAAE
ncbi:50S ribosomal protein L25/general stress protein Ctc [Pseudoluteimonas lycopersici]|uniref:Large ribosomal subunit protein bL25 n=1 Tax=Pseudoluteimonas lycopersici TaxID=1324796 RepID=A0A516V831_9GAMM|nr:50S ribosomal protein L25/general stress protein Ctc [Lysobacter lycopersici]QDQ74676.1 50S ribosomal protein L25/general stress protein Ctc [Lysobacter lycopersici]